jgi:hypothetical protein
VAPFSWMLAGLIWSPNSPSGLKANVSPLGDPEDQHVAAPRPTRDGLLLQQLLDLFVG